MKTQAGFTVIELMVVVTVIAIIAAIALPALLRSRMHANETAAIQNLRTLHSAETGFHNTKNRFGDIEELKSEEDGQGLGYLDISWSEGGVKQGYEFSMNQSDTGFFLCYADPETPMITGVRYFRVDTSGVIRWNREGRPSDSDPAISSQF